MLANTHSVPLCPFIFSCYMLCLVCPGDSWILSVWTTCNQVHMHDSCLRWGKRKILEIKGVQSKKVKPNCISPFPLVGMENLLFQKRLGQNFLKFLNIFFSGPTEVTNSDNSTFLNQSCRLEHSASWFIMLLSTLL